jgi:hypothetical protein
MGAVTTTGKLVASGSALVSALWKLDGYVVSDEEMAVADAADAAVTAKVTVTPYWSRWRPAAALATLAMTMLAMTTGAAGARAGRGARVLFASVNTLPTRSSRGDASP